MSVPRVEKLTINYRTHNGILGCAAELVEVMLSLFPNAVDRLAKDRGHFNGPKPQILTETSTDDLAILLVGSDKTHSQIEFGAHQAVLVRSQAAKESLPDEFDGALVLTIFEAKGLEFDDVFIYNFFKDSPADEKTWRVITSWWEEKRRPDLTAAERAELAIAPPRPVSFSKEKHGILEEELKQLCAFSPLSRHSHPFSPVLTHSHPFALIRTHSRPRRGPSCLPSGRLFALIVCRRAPL